MSAARLLILSSLLALFVSCNQSGGGGGAVEVNTSGIFNPVSLSYNNVEIQPIHDLGEFLLGTQKKVLIFKIRNNSVYPIHQMNVVIEGNASFGFKFNKSPEGAGGFPGYKGTCSTSLLPGQSCDVALQFETSIKGWYEQDITFNYVNLVESASRPLKLLMLAGNQASLVFDEEDTNYVFGDKVGLAQIPVVERADKVSLQKVLNVTNTGDLRARDIKLILAQQCETTVDESGLCPSGLNNAYSITHNCPAILMAEEKCQATVTYAPKNWDVDPANPIATWKEVNFTSTLKFDYLNSMEGPNNKAALNAYFNSVSTNIEANFKTSLDTLPFDSPLTVGNRLSKSFRINNKGYREGKPRRLEIVQGTTVIGYCVRGSTTVMDCYTDSALTIPLTLAAFPFYFKDKNNCFGTTAVSDGATMLVDSGCQMELTFQPSVTYKTSGSTLFKLNVEFDGNWKGMLSIRKNFLMTSQGTHMAAARLIPEKVTYLGKTLPLTSLHALNEIASFDLGRIGMMSSNSFKRSAIDITFKNVGDVQADVISVKDTWNITIPNKEANPTGVDLKPAGGDTKPHYIKAKIGTAYCNQIPPGQSCTVTMEYAPISKGSVELTREYSFDVINNDNPLLSYKTFFFNYNDGSMYSDLNRGTDIDAGLATSEARLLSNMVAKGQLGDAINKMRPTITAPYPYTNPLRGYAILTNIGTDRIRYIGYNGDDGYGADKDNQPSGRRIVASDLAAISAANASSLYKPLKDCKDIIDYTWSGGQNCTIVNAKVYSAGNPSGLGYLDPDESCAATYELYTTPHRYLDTIGSAGAGIELARLKAQSVAGTLYNRDYDVASYNIPDVKVTYYDNDVSDPNATGNLAACFGSRQDGDDPKIDLHIRLPGRIVPHSPFPISSAIMLRPAYSLVQVLDENSNVLRAALPIPELWAFSGDNVGDLTTSTTLDADIVTASLSKTHLQGLNISPLNLNNYDYIIHLGTFPVGQSIATGFTLSSAVSGLTAVWKGSTSQMVMNPSGLSNQFVFNIATLMNAPIAGSELKFPATSGEPVNITFTPDMDGVYATEFTYTYNNGDYVGTFANPVQITSKILIIAEGRSNASDLGVKVASYKVETDGYNAPVITPSNAAGFVAGDYTTYSPGSGDSSPASTILLDEVTVAAPGTADHFVRKHIYVWNKSTTDTMTNFKLIGKSTASSPKIKSLNLGNYTKFCFDNSSTKCAGTCSGVTSLAPGAGCYFEVFYQPNESEVTQDVTIQANYQIKANQHNSRNITVSFLPKAPAILVAQGKNTEIIRVTSVGNMSSYGMDFGLATEMTADPQLISFDKSSGVMKRLEIVNSSVTRASFLKTYHVWKGSSDINMIPADADYNYTQDGVNYAQIFQKNYSSGQPHMKVYASKPCLLGGTSSADLDLPLFQKGFNNASVGSCYIALVLFANSHYINIQFASTSPASLMDPNHIRLPYYDNDRSSFKYFNVHFTGKLKPNGSTGVPNNASAYFGVKAGSDGTVTFKWNEMTPKHAGLGAIVGYRIYYSTSQSALNDIYLAQASKVDDYNVPNGTGVYQMTQTALAAKKYYYYRVVPIRQYANYNPTATFPGVTPFYQLTGNRFLSETGVPQIAVVVPPTDMYYDHANQMLIYRNIKSTDLLTIAQARTACTSITKVRLSKSGGTVDYTNRLITQTAWNSVIANQSELGANPYLYTTWLDGTTQNIHTTLSTVPGYTATDEAKYISASSIFYQKVNLCQPNCSGDKAVGTVYHNPDYQGWTSYISAGYVYGSARCYVNLSSP